MMERSGGDDVPLGLASEVCEQHGKVKRKGVNEPEWVKAHKNFASCTAYTHPSYQVD